MELCLMFDPHEGASWEDWCRLAVATEAAGLDGLFCGDHYSRPGEPSKGALDVWTAMAGVATVTSRIRLGTLVSPITFRHPSVMARIATTVDHISGGRVELGLGTGWNVPAHVRNGVPFGSAAERFDDFTEQLDVIVKSWTEESFDFVGEHYELRGQSALPLPVQKPHPPIILGGRARRRSAALAARLAQEYNCATVTFDEYLARNQAIDRACEDQGRDPSTLKRSFFFWGFIVERESDVLGALERMLKALGDDRDPLAVQRNPGDWIFGTLDQVLEQLAPFQEAGARRFYFKLIDFRDLDSLERLSQLVKSLG